MERCDFVVALHANSSIKRCLAELIGKACLKITCKHLADLRCLVKDLEKTIQRLEQQDVEKTIQCLEQREGMYNNILEVTEYHIL